MRGCRPDRRASDRRGRACPAIFIGSDEQPVALCTKILDRAPVVHVLDKQTGASLASLDLPKGGLFSGVSTYLDERDRLVMIDGRGDLLRIAHRQSADGTWNLDVAERTSLASAIPDGDAGVGLAPDWQGRVWFATGGGVVGFHDPATNRVVSVRLPDGERVDNSIATGPAGTAVATGHALYLLEAGPDGAPRIKWRRPYERGPARKPGQLSHGTGSTPTFFGPRRGAEYVAIVDNAAPTERLLVWTTGGRKACEVPVIDGSENSPIGSGNTVIVASTYGYPYPATPDGAGESEPRSAPFGGGMTRVDLRRGGCDVVWRSTVRSSAVPKLSVVDGLIYTATRRSPLGATATPLDGYAATVVDAATGKALRSTPIGIGFFADTLQLAGQVGPGRTYWQGTISGVVRVSSGS